MNLTTRAAQLLDNDYHQGQHLTKQIVRGLVLAIAGTVQIAWTDSYTGEKQWRVGTNSELYKVRFYGHPRRWECSCKQGREFGPVVQFEGHHGRICKHIVAAHLCNSTSQWPDMPATVSALVTRLVDSQAIGYLAPKQCWILPFRKSVKVKRLDQDSRDVLVLEAPGVRSRAIAYAGSEPTQSGSKTVWRFYDNWMANYNEFVKRVNNV